MMAGIFLAAHPFSPRNKRKTRRFYDGRDKLRGLVTKEGAQIRCSIRPVAACSLQTGFGAKRFESIPV